MAHSDCGWTYGCAGKTVKSLENTCHTSALLRWWFTTKRRYIKCIWTFAFYLLPRDAAKALSLLSSGVYPSVMLVYSIEKAQDIVKLLSRPSSPIIQVFWPQRRYSIPRETPSAGALNTRGWEHFAIFDCNRHLSRKCEIGRWLLSNVNRKSRVPDRMVSFSMTLSDP